MGVLTWLRSKLSNGQLTMTAMDNSEFFGLLSDTYIRMLAFESGVRIMANAVSKCEFKTYRQGKEFKGDEYYLWNVEPNRNQNSSQFIQKWIHQLYRHNEALILSINNQLLVADSFQKKPYALYDYSFTNVVVEDFIFNGPFQMSDVMYFRLGETDMQQVLEGLNTSYSKLIAYAMTSYQRSKGERGTLEYDTLPVAGSEQDKAFQDLMSNRFKTFFTADNAVLPLGRGYKYTSTSGKSGASETTRDIRAMIDDICEFTAKGFGIPPTLIKGDVAGVSAAVDQLLTFGVDPLVDMCQEEINRKRYGRTLYLSGNYLKIDTRAIKHVDLLSVSSAIDKLIASGAFCINDIRVLVGDEPIDEPWAWQHWMTKNYSKVEELLEAMQQGGGGGE